MSPVEPDDLAAIRRELSQLRGLLPPRPVAGTANFDRDLARLMLALTDACRNVLERQILLRIDRGALSDDETERVGLALLQFDSALGELATLFGLERTDLSINPSTLEHGP